MVHKYIGIFVNLLADWGFPRTKDKSCGHICKEKKNLSHLLLRLDSNSYRILLFKLKMGSTLNSFSDYSYYTYNTSTILFLTDIHTLTIHVIICN
jgi:hypothetical protein